MSSRRNCCVVNCHNYERKNPKLAFYSFPNRTWEFGRKQAWLKAVGRDTNKNGMLWTPTKNTRICSEHFIGGTKSDDPRSPAFIPTVFSNVDRNKLKENNAKVVRSTVTNRYNLEKSPTDDANEENVSSKASSVEIGTQTDSLIIFDDNGVSSANDESGVNGIVMFCWNSTTEASTQTNIMIPKNDEHTRTAVLSIKLKPKSKNASCGPDVELRDGFVGYDNIKTDLIMSQLGGVSLQSFAMLLSLLIPSTNGQPSYYRKIDKKNRLLMFLMKIKLGITFCSLGCIFRIHTTTASRIFFEILKSLSNSTANWIFWPSKAAVEKTLPLSFHNYPNCRAIIDCTEIKCNTPPTVEQRVLMYSNYKGCFTFKFLIGITPNGYISFLSKAYGGRATDGFITNDSGFLNLIEPGDMIMADKGFPQIKSEVLGRRATLVMPPFCHNPQFTGQEVEEGYNIASVRIHVERAIQRTKVYNILDHIINVELFPHIDKIMHMCCVLANLQPPLIK